MMMEASIMGQDGHDEFASTSTQTSTKSDDGLSSRVINVESHRRIGAKHEDIVTNCASSSKYRLPKLFFDNNDVMTPLTPTVDLTPPTADHNRDGSIEPQFISLSEDAEPHGDSNVVVTDDNEEAFRIKEAKRRARNVHISISRSAKDLIKRPSARVLVTSLKATKLFLSHCWRDVDIKTQKEEMFSYLTQKGCVFWADFLDLQDEGAVEWRREIEEAICGCNKFVAFIDFQYLLSFNCMEEMAFAIREQKPTVLSILDQDAWNLITSIGGAEEAWSAQPAMGLPLSSFEGKSMGPDKEPFSIKMLEQIFSALSNINFCPCRELDFQLEGKDLVYKRLFRFIEKDLDYAKEFADLKQKAAAWEAAGRPWGLLVSRKDAREWDQWIDVADKTEAQPTPTDMQRTYVHASVKEARKQGKVRLAALAVAMLLILMGAVAAVVMAFRAEKQREVAEEQRTIADKQRTLADGQRILAEQQRAFAEEQQAKAEYQGAVASILLLSADRMPYTTAGIRAQTLAADLAGSYNMPAVVLPALHDSLEYLLGKPYQFLDLAGHRAQINSVDFSPSGSSLISSSKDGKVIVWPISWDDSALVPELVHPAVLSGGLEMDRCLFAQWMTDDTFAAAFEGGGFQVWQKQVDGNWRAELSTAPHKKKILAMALSGDGSKVATADKSNQVAMWRFNENAPLSEASAQVFSAPDRIDGMVFSPDGRYLIFGYTKGVLAYCDVREELGNMEQDPEINDLMVLPSTGNVQALAFSPDRRWLAAGLKDGTAHVIGWNEASISSSKVMFSISSPAPMMSSFKAVVGLTWSSETELLVAEDVGSVSIWEVRSQGDEDADREPVLQHQLVYQTSTAATSAPIPVTGVAFSSNIGGGTIAMSSEESMLRLWFPTPQLGHRGHLDFRMQISSNYPSEITAVAWSRTRMAACSNEGGLGIWELNPATGDWYQAAGLPVDDDGKGNCRSLAWAPDGSMVAAGTIGATVEVWQRQQDGEWVCVMRGAAAGDVRRNPSFSPDSRWLAVPGKKSPEIWLFHVPSQLLSGPKDEAPKQPDHVLKHPEGEIKSITWAPFSPSKAASLLLASSGEDSTRLWELSEVSTEESPSLAVKGITTLDLGFPYATQMDWSADGRLFTMSHEGIGQVWHWQDGLVNAVKEGGGWVALLPVEGHTGVLGSVSWSPDGSQLVVPYDDNSLRIYNVDGDAGRAEVYYQIEHNCEWLNWKTVSIDIEREASRIACANTAGAAAVVGEKFDFAFELLMVDFEEQRQLLQHMTYGRLTSRDLQILRLERLEAQVLPELVDNRN